MLCPTQISIPTLVRDKQDALDRLGLYLTWDARRDLVIVSIFGLPEHLQNVEDNEPNIDHLFATDPLLLACFTD